MDSVADSLEPGSSAESFAPLAVAVVAVVVVVVGNLFS